ncbi:MAG: hypothetical protein COB20_06515 [SAR86 cluster bacterium]|uniref:Lipoprotein n=1 Tax=SAR86 cluster bacterium TaxID=2030880 RepID=A0A2A4X7G6_9GAMM|nr:MAG: hypothetical protein COB20_06515 [SAR86 cluster bacterium]
MKYPKLIASLILALSLTGCIGSVIGVAVDTTTAVIKAPFQIAGAVVGVAADTTGTVIAAPFRMAHAAVGGGHHDDHDRRRGHDHSEHQNAHPGDAEGQHVDAH